MKITNFKIGSDPEYALIDQNNFFVSAIGKVGGSKSVPLSIGNGCSRQEDNVAIEFCIPPCTNKKEFLDYLNYCEEKGDELVSKMNLKLVAVSSANYREKELANKNAQQFGCSESNCAYSYYSMKPDTKQAGNMRTFGFHIHVGFKMPDDVDAESIQNFIKYMDMYLGLPSILIDDDSKRRTLYGKAGDYRVRAINDDLVIEYRSLGGALLATDDLKAWVYDNTLLAIENFNNQTELISDELMQEAINNSDQYLANKLINDNSNININYLGSSIWKSQKVNG